MTPRPPIGVHRGARVLASLLPIGHLESYMTPSCMAVHFLQPSKLGFGGLRRD
jgi:hypothetical protein